MAINPKAKQPSLKLNKDLSSFLIAGLPFYDPSKDFTCLDGLLTIPFNSVNDDYCDCSDGSDEPG